jgi:SAM-dependent methyltransferase
MDLREIPSGELVRHPWEVARARFFAELIARHGPAGVPVEALDVGAGDGYAGGILVRHLPGGSSVVCYDEYYDRDFLAAAKQSASAELTFTAERPNRRFDLLLALDVLEHVEDDASLLAGLVDDLVRPGGIVLLSVPAWPGLFTGHDVVLGHHRRYLPSELDGLARGAGLAPLSRGGLFHSLLLPRALSRARDLLGGKGAQPAAHPAGAPVETAVGSWPDRPLLTRLVNRWLTLDNRVSAWLSRSGVHLPGLSTWWLGRKP